jgi:hypothetical protein
MKKSLVSFMVLLLFALIVLPAYAQEYGTVTVMPPTEDCEVFIDGIQLGLGTTTSKIKEGTHNVVVNLKDGTPLYNEQVEIVAKEVATINVSYELKKKSKLTPVNEPGKNKITPSKGNQGDSDLVKEAMNRENLNIKEWGAGWGLSIGADNTNYTISGLGQSETLDLGAQLNFDWFYAWKLSEALYTELSISLLRTYGGFKNANGTTTQVAAAPISLNVKFKANENIMLGGGINYSLWSWTAPGASMPSVTAGIGYQIFTEIKPISSEIGYIIKNGSFANSGVDFTLASAGIYYKYKLYF